MSMVIAQPNIEVILKGLLTIFANDKQCVVGLLRETPAHHALKITVLKSINGGPFEPFAELNDADIKGELTLEVDYKTGISFRKKKVGINRLNGPTLNDNDSFDWIVDFERDIFKRRVDTKKSGFISLLTLNHGELLTRVVSRNKLKTRIGRNGPEEVFGHVACETGIDIVLDHPKAKAIFKNGNQVIFESDPDSRYQITIDRGPAAGHSHGQAIINDADFYYTAIEPDLTDADRVFFTSTPFSTSPMPPPPITPDAVCFNSGAGERPPGT